MTTTTPSSTSSQSSQGNAMNLYRDVSATVSSIEKGDWLAAGMSLSNTAMDIIGFSGNPMSGLISAGVGFIIDHIKFLKEPFDKLLGDPSSIAGNSSGFGQAAQLLTSNANQLRTMSVSQTKTWTGAAGDGYRATADQNATGLDSLAKVSQGISDALKVVGEVLAKVRKAVLDLLSQAVEKIVMIMLEALAASWCSFGASLAHGIAQSVMTAVQSASKMMSEVQKFVSSAQKVIQVVQKVMQIAQAVNQLLQVIGNKANPNAPTTGPAVNPVVSTAVNDQQAQYQYTNQVGPALTTAPSSAAPGYTYGGGYQAPSTLSAQPTYQPTAPAPGYSYGGGYQAPSSSGRQPAGSQPAPTTGRVPSPPIVASGTGQTGQTQQTATYDPTTGRWTLPPHVPDWGPSGPPPDPGHPMSRVDLARNIGGAVQLLVENGVDPSKIDMNRVAEIVNQTSGGNPHAFDMSDPNAANGMPPKGLLGVTDAGFAQHAMPGHNDIWQPMDNLLAGMQQLLSQMGSILSQAAGGPAAPAADPAQTHYNLF